MAPSERTGFMPLEEFRRRMRMHIDQGWQPVLPRQEIIINPAFSASFEKFARSAAHELRHYIVYRSDGGLFARGLVRSTGDLQRIHKDLHDLGIKEGAKVRLAAALYRRKHAEPTRRYMMAVQFAHIPITGDAEVVEASPAVTQQSGGEPREPRARLGRAGRRRAQMERRPQEARSRLGCRRAPPRLSQIPRALAL
jgi:predicted SprT family Zn-dependent metalloprotease